MVESLEEISDSLGEKMKEKSEMGEVLDNLDADILNKETHMSTVDFNTRLTDHEISCILVIDELQRLKIFPEDTGITRQKKRLAISLEGKGREEKVKILSADRDFKTGGSLGEKFGSLFQKKG